MKHTKMVRMLIFAWEKGPGSKVGWSSWWSSWASLLSVREAITGLGGNVDGGGQN